MKATERNELQLEIKARKELIKRLAYPLDQLTKADAKERSKREERTAALSEYKTQEDAHEAYGYDVITEEEYQAICEALEAGEKYVTETMTPVSLAMKILRDFIRHMESELRSLEFELLPPEEQTRRMEAAEKHREEMEARRERRRLHENEV
ncbi:MAG: hypothetical protein PHE09_19895 [Oscillospiraceae bacterium]|nr:hypothetical protein [Oscillospiraceae bacterium]